MPSGLQEAGGESLLSSSRWLTAAVDSPSLFNQGPSERPLGGFPSFAKSASSIFKTFPLLRFSSQAGPPRWALCPQRHPGVAIHAQPVCGGHFTEQLQPSAPSSGAVHPPHHGALRPCPPNPGWGFQGSPSWAASWEQMYSFPAPLCYILLAADRKMLTFYHVSSCI